ncbi:hypothetical protein F4814DRAFT_424427, partial [Daldinia grandis]
MILEIIILTALLALGYIIFEPTGLSHVIRVTPIVISDGSNPDSDIDEVEAQVKSEKDTTNMMLTQVLESQMEEAQKVQDSKIDNLEKALSELCERLDGHDYGILQWKGDLQQLAKGMGMVSTPDKNDQY